MGVRYFTAPPSFYYEKETVMDMYRPTRILLCLSTIMTG